ncbi:probable cysteine--tRNA ligase, mitochondrial isoform X1 [Polyodon spathula]|uniref:probable cysteine--tRNA ligase, mitochondrial isoform X1 n=2 Tax=Polyodon spathula TaxID=7913 RepID=UPI001B7E28BB|nr:probable cysteine--tRNA ligase, mitochondrial isoform X1 [Polyodon spathula]
MSIVNHLLPFWRLTSKTRLFDLSYFKARTFQEINVDCFNKVKHFRSVTLCTGSEKKWQKPMGFDTGLKTYNSLTKGKEPLILAKEGIATWYSCGPTVYDHAHLGHACSYVRFDIVQRILTRVFGINVIHVMVITDIDDKIIKRASELNMSSTVLARLYEEEFKSDMAALKVLPPTVYMRVTENIPQIIAFIEGIINKQHAYATPKGSVYFDIKSIGSRYGKLMGGFVDSGGELGDTGDTDKRNARDFALWKASKPQEPFWESPWGKGRPGWHIECSTIASTVFGSQLDIHSGGIDLAFPHHENEIAQCEAYHQCAQWGNYFLHSGHLHLKGSEEKMSKSLKNFITIKDFLQTFSANEFRMFCLLTKYRSAIDYSDASMNEAKSVLSSISSFFNDAGAYMTGKLLCQSVDEGFLWKRLAAAKVDVQTALTDDFDTPRAVDAIMGLIHHGNRQLQSVTKGGQSSRSPAVFGAILSYIEGFLDTVGVAVKENTCVTGESSPGTLPSVVEQLVSFRSRVRSYALATDELAPVLSDCSELSEERKSQLKEHRKQLIQEREPLLKACDVLRRDLAPLGINIKDRGNTSTWEITEKRTELQKEEAN